ncbi:hypothetical protein Lal_00032832 [Lupinus albus]|uniref:Uncharacterized protein n=1 Tax=Lupinus albus TaxID=3870 RepID=A0A6A4RB31_LUPAL|nr:hypothetical protein Lalb_Chr01g0022091 [Lupinus albus]KAF1898068.1 hypothetical protein Lal_00032832 [Lupinus albus]
MSRVAQKIDLLSNIIFRLTGAQVVKPPQVGLITVHAHVESIVNVTLALVPRLLLLELVAHVPQAALVPHAELDINNTMLSHHLHV